ncbi:MAG: hypothetical protein DRP74_02595 [Candidatus Omnitrophota bacterium]|nr:MAG: hypothetical protein DRP74_02595 [Candidatus Omnitrophota bacterium]
MRKFNPEWLNKPRKRGNPEGVIQRQILGYLKPICQAVGKTKTMGVRRGKAFCYDPFTFRGFPDITFFKDNKIGFIEVKSATGRQTKEQRHFQELCQTAGLTYILARDLSDVTRIIK